MSIRGTLFRAPHSAPLRREVERKLSNLMAHLRANESSLDRLSGCTQEFGIRRGARCHSAWQRRMSLV
jgi:hypothetical protein